MRHACFALLSMLGEKGSTRVLCAVTALWLWSVAGLGAQQTPSLPPIEEPPREGSGAIILPPPSNRVFEANVGTFTPETYAAAVEALLSAFEQASGRQLVPGERKRAALKVYSDSGSGLSTPVHLVRGVISALVRRGFQREALFIVGLNEGRLRASGFLPPLSDGGNTFDGVPVLALDSGRYYDLAWFYDSPLPSRLPAPSADGEPGGGERVTPELDRKSMLPVPLIFDADFWINLPSCSDHPVLGLNGALVNATLWNASNTFRFFRSPVTGPAAVAEIAAIPELRERLVCTIISLERYQFIGGPIFNSLYTVSEPLVWLSDNPVMIDALMRARIDQARRATGFAVLPDDMRMLEYAEQLGLGADDPALIQWAYVRTEEDVAR